MMIKMATEINFEKYPIGCGEFDKENPQLMRSCGDVLFCNKVWLCENCRKKNYTNAQKKIIERGNELQ